MTAIPPPAPVPFEFNGVVRLTKVGTAFIVFTVVIGFSALNTGNNPLYIGLTAMLGCLLLSGMASKGGLKHLEVEVGGMEQVWAGRASDATLRVTNRSRIWNVRDVVIASPDLAEPLLIPVLPRRTGGEFPARFLFRKRGRVELRPVDLYTRYPFGFFFKKRRVGVRSEVVVFPRLLGGAVERARFRPSTGEQTTSNRPGPGSEIHSFREYVRGDSLRHVAWKKSASLGRWIIKQTDADAARTVQVAVDPFRPRGVTEEQFELMVSEAATFIHEALERGLDVVLLLPRTSMRARSAGAGMAMFHALALLEPTLEPFDQTVESSTVVFSLRGGDAAIA